MSAKAEKDFLAEIAEEFPDDIDIGRDSADIIDWIETGNYALNRIVSGNYFLGYPTAKITELFGEPSTGKSLLIYMAIASFQKQFAENAVVILDDVEDAYSNTQGDMCGVDSHRLLRINSATVEEHFCKLFNGTKARMQENEDGDTVKIPAKPGLIPLIRSKNPKARIMIALDSVAMLSCEHEKTLAEEGMEKKDMSRSQLIRTGIRSNWDTIRDGGIFYLVANHVYDIIGGYGNQKGTPGGKAIPFMSSVRVELSNGGRISEDNKNSDEGAKAIQIGARIVAYVKKNKVAPPFGRAVLDHYWDKPQTERAPGIDRMSGVVDLLAQDGIIHVASGMLTLPDKSKVRRGAFTEERFLALMESLREKVAVTETEQNKK
jgi:RecA/RadA recombinase